MSIKSTSNEKAVDLEHQGTAVVLPVEHEEDAVFGQVNTDGSSNFRSLGFYGAIMLEIKSQIGLGVLSIPFLFQVVGMVPGVILFVVIAIAITWCNYVVGEIKARYPAVYGIDDLGYHMAGTFGKYYFAAASVIYLVTASGSGMLSLSIALNSLSMHGACTAAFVAIVAVMVGAVASVQTLHKLSWISWAGVISIFVGIFTIMIATGVQDRPADAPQVGPWDKNLVIFGSPEFSKVGSTLGGMVFTLAVTPAFMSVVCEMRDQRQYPRTVLISMGLVSLIDIIVGVVVYYYCGQYVASPSPGSAGVLLKRVAYGISFPGILVSAILLTHFPAKYIFVRALKGSRHLSQKTWQHWVVWFSCTSGCTLVAYIVASGIPIFSSLSSLIGSFFGPAVSLQPLGLFWLYDNWKYIRANRTASFWRHMSAAGFAVVLGFFLQVVGTYGSITDIIEGFHNGEITKPWSCADNSNSV